LAQAILAQAVLARLNLLARVVAGRIAILHLLS